MFAGFVTFLIIAVIIFIIAIIWKKIGSEYSEVGSKVLYGVSGSIILIAIIFFICSTFYSVQPGEVGIEIFFGKVVHYSDSGLHGKNPLSEVKKMSLQTRKFDTKLEGASKDLQEIGVDISINYRLNYEKISELYNKVGIDYEAKVIVPAVLNLAKAGISQFPISDIIVKRTELANTIYESLKERLASYYIILETVNLSNISFSKEFTAAVTEKQVQEQNVQTAEYKRQQAIKDKESVILAAQAEAEKQRLLRNTTSPEVIELKWIEKWNGQLPNTILGDKSVPMINFNK